MGNGTGTGTEKRKGMILCAMTMIEINGFMAVGARILAEINQKMLKVTFYDCEIDAAI